MSRVSGGGWARKLVIILSALLLLFMIAVSPFAHTCVKYHHFKSGSYTSTSHDTHRYAIRIFAAFPVLRSDCESCPVCTWAQTNTSIALPVCAIIFSGFLFVCFVPHKLERPANRFGYNQNTPRAPPLI